LAIILSGITARASAQSLWKSDNLEKKVNQSHLLDASRFSLPAGNPEELFLQRLRTIHAKEIGEALRKKYSQTPAQLDQLLRDNPEFIKKYLENFKMDDLPGELRKKFAGRETELEKLIRSMDLKDFLNYAREERAHPPLPNADGSLGGGSAGASPTPSAGEPAASSEPASPTDRDATIPEPPPSAESPDEAQANSVLGRWLLQAANHVKDLDPSLRNSPALRNALRELGRKIEGADERWKALDRSANAVADKWARLGQALPLDRLLPEKGLSWPRSLTPESLPNWHWPQVRSRTGGSASLRTPPTVQITEGAGWRTLGMLAILVVLALVVQRILARARAGRLGEEADGWKLGPWPVDPKAVRTREELIRAFEYLSVLRLGPAARHWHHLAIAAGLGQFSRKAVSTRGWGDAWSERRRAAEQLAFLYERARYAPPGEPLPETALATAQRDLCLLAGVPVS
jgi:hypothetical protein